ARSVHPISGRSVCRRQIPDRWPRHLFTTSPRSISRPRMRQRQHDQAPAAHAAMTPNHGGIGMANKSYIIALEEHYLDPEVKQYGSPGAGPEIVSRLDDLGALRLKEMDEAGIDFQVLSHSIPGLQGVDAATGVPLARRVNDRLHEAVGRHPD